MRSRDEEPTHTFGWLVVVAPYDVLKTHAPLPSFILTSRKLCGSPRLVELAARATQHDPPAHSMNIPILLIYSLQELLYLYLAWYGLIDRPREPSGGYKVVKHTCML